MNDKIIIENEPWYAACLSTYFPGLGQFYAHRMKRGVILFLLFVVSLISCLWCIFSYDGNIVLGYLLISFSLLIYIISIYDAFHITKSQNITHSDILRHQNKDPFLAFLFSSVLPGTGHLYARKWILGISITIFYLMLNMINFGFFYDVTIILLEVLIAYNAYCITKQRYIVKKYIIILVSFQVIISFMMLICIDYIMPHYRILGFYEGDSNYPTLQDGDLLLCDVRMENGIKRGDFVSIEGMISKQLQVIVKRVVALENETIEIVDGAIIINNQKLSSDSLTRFRYVIDSTSKYALPGHPETIAQNNIFVLGDNSQYSTDSRHFGQIDTRNIKNICYKVLWPLSRIKTLWSTPSP